MWQQMLRFSQACILRCIVFWSAVWSDEDIIPPTEALPMPRRRENMPSLAGITMATFRQSTIVIISENGEVGVVGAYIWMLRTLHSISTSDVWPSSSWIAFQLLARVNGGTGARWTLTVSTFAKPVGLDGVFLAMALAVLFEGPQRPEPSVALALRSASLPAALSLSPLCFVCCPVLLSRMSAIALAPTDRKSFLFPLGIDWDCVSRDTAWLERLVSPLCCVCVYVVDRFCFLSPL
mmetsp:Transcript_5984/g.10980  ORF Transcript_5984/g.10980 Transcript_5984/m.10980 type:complete len:236 (+) Transcript_5984:701-1408(+)